MIWPQKYKLKQKTRFTRFKTALQENMAVFIQIIKVHFFQIFNHWYLLHKNLVDSSMVLWKLIFVPIAHLWTESCINWFFSKLWAFWLANIKINIAISQSNCSTLGNYFDEINLQMILPIIFLTISWGIWGYWTTTRNHENYNQWII